MSGTETLDGIDCLVVAGKPPSQERRTFWIGREDFFVRRLQFTTVHAQRWYREQRQRIEEELKHAAPGEERVAAEKALEVFSRPHEDSRSETTLLFHPEPDPSIPAKLFATPASWRDS